MNIALPCKTVNHVFSKAMSGASIYFSIGEYKVVGVIEIRADDLFISGGWNDSYTSQNQKTVLYGDGLGNLAIRGKNTEINNLVFTNLSAGISVYSDGELLLRNSALTNSYTGISNSGNTTLINTTISGNREYGIRASGFLTIINSTIAFNGGDAILNNTPNLTFQNSIISQNEGSCYGNKIKSKGYNIVEHPCSKLFNLSSTDKDSVNPNLSQIVQGSHHALLPGSPAIDAIPLTSSSNCPAVDIRGINRPVGSKCDIGAYEYKSVGDPNDLIIFSGNSQITGPNRKFKEPLRVQVVDSFGTPVKGISVHFNAPSDGASGIFGKTGTSTATVITDVSGIATAGYLTANWISGEYHVDAAIQNGNQKVTFTFINRALFVSLSGTDQNNNCTSQLEPCRSLAYTLSKSVPGYSIFIEQGKFAGQNSVMINVDDIHILGGWNPAFTAQTGQTIFEGKQSSGTFELRSKNNFISNVILTNFSIGLDVHSFGTAAVENSAFTGNGTGIQNRGNLSLVNVTVSENINGITNSGPLTINNATIVNNAWYGLIQQYQYQYAMQIRNSIVANNAENCDIFSNNTIKSLGYNIFDKKCGDGFKSSSTDKYGVNPRLSSLLLNSFHALLPNSPAINAIPKTAYCPSNDIRGLSRPIEDKCDIGAYEYTTPGDPSQILPFPYDTIITGTNLPSSSPLNVLVLDSNHAPVPDVSVKFSSPTTGPGGTFEHSGTHTITIVTNSSGIAYAGPYIANHEVGKYTVVISAEAYQLSSIFSIEHLNLYISPTGTNTSNNCQIASSPCQTLAYALSIAAPGVSILVSEGTYNISSEITVGVNNLYISGGWDPTFSLQNKRTLFRGSSNLLLVKSKGISFDHIIFSDANNAVVVGSSADLTILNSSFTNNTTGIENNGKLTLINTTISANRGTGIRNSTKTYLINTTMVNNKTNAIYQTNAYAIVYLQNSIIAPGQNCYNAGTLISNGFNLLGGVCAHHTITKITDQIGIDPGLSILINQSYHALQPGSPAIDAINRNAPGAYCPERDTRGVTRQPNAPCDIGAYEFTVPGQPVQNQIVQGANQKIGPLQAPIMPLQVLVLDQIGSPVGGVIVTFTAPASGASGTFGTSYTSAITTDPGGVASQSYFRANKIKGSYTVTASVLGIAGSLSFALENGGSIYVNSATGNDGTDCRSIDQPCRTISRAYTAATSWDAIYLASGEYTNSQITIEKHLFISGGWNNDFTSQINYSTLVGSTISISQGYDFSQAYTLSLDRINTRGLRFINNIKGSLRITNGSITGACNAIYNLGTLELVNATISNNTCFPSDSTTVKGAGIYNKGGYARLVNVTITRNHLFYAKTTSSNTMNNAGGIFVYDGLVVLKNSILSNNRSNSGFDCYGPIHSLGNNIVGNASGCVINTAPGDLIGSLAESVSAHLAELVTENTSFHALLSGSPAIDSGDPAACPSHDQRGQIRPAGSGCDMGAYEGTIVGVPTPFAITFSSNSYEAYPGSYRCMSPSANCDASEEDANLAHAYGLAFLQFMMDKHGRNGIDGAGTPLISSVRYKSNYQNAFWTNFGFQIVYGNGYPKADDIVAHEITHGITQTTSNLFYYYQSGAINESLSDLWGEYFDQENGIENDSDSVKWLIGEGLPSGSIRNMKNPPAFRDPDRMTSVHYYKGSNDNGGVHWNSGVNNKAIYLMVDGGTFNNRTVRALGWEKTAAVYYYAQTRLLTSASDYLDLYHALSQACSALINGKEGINEI
jgi:hypothetical protein